LPEPIQPFILKKNPSSFLDFKIGILGGGQLGLMLAQAASDWHLEPEFLDPDEFAPVKPFGILRLGSFQDFETVLAFGKDKDLISIEIENVNLEALKTLEKRGISVFPQPRVLEIIKNKAKQKQFFADNGFQSAEFQIFTHNNKEAASSFLPAFWKQNEGGYDGKGVKKIQTFQDLEEVPHAPGFLEKKVDILKEIAVLVSRNASGQTSVFPLVEQVFHPEAHLVSFLKTPANVEEDIEVQCKAIALRLIEKLEMVGLLAVEFFIDVNSQVLVNEIAPRPHNSGHHSIEGFATSQFRQFWRAILNLPPGDTKAIFPYAAMVNLVGEPVFSGKPVYQGLSDCLALQGVHIHLYGKKETRPFRKMGHITLTATSLAELDQKVSFVQNHLKIISNNN
jgi:5-(carboxyamino)imidazole ribonucleotide synthase